MLINAIRKPAREIVFDTETTGIDPGSGHRLVEIGLVEMIGRVETGRVWHAYFNPERAMPSEAQAIHGLSEQFLSDKPLFSHLVDELMEFIGDSMLVAHNAQFDMAFLDHELARCGRQGLGGTRAIDTLAIARTRHPGSKHSLDALCTRYGIDRTHRIKHGALLDAQLLAQVYIELTGGRQIGLDLVQDGAVATGEISGNNMAVANRIHRPARFHTATQAELERHAAFVARLADPLWQAEAEPA